MKVYLDTNAIREATQLWPSAHALQSALSVAGHLFSLGGHVMYELARAFVAGRVDPRPTFCILANMDRIYYVPSPGQLIQNEVDRLRTGAVVLAPMDQTMAAAMSTELYMLCHGHAGLAREFIAEREQRLAAGHRRMAQMNRDMLRDFVRANQQIRGRMQTWEGFRLVLRPLWEPIVLKVTGALPRGLAQRFFDRPEEFPVINTWLRAQLHLMFLSWRPGELPAQGRVDDYRNAIEANATDLFVTNDDRLYRRFSDINPFRPVQSWQDFLTTLIPP